jgi:hypothetical protein
MTLARTVIAIIALAGAFVLGVWTGPYLIEKPVERAQQAVVDTNEVDAPVATTGRARTARPRREAIAPPVATLSASEPELHKQLKPIMNRGTDMEIAAQGFRDAEQFATLAHAARNTAIPFAVLKHRVLEQSKSLAVAIEEFKPQMNGNTEARRAREAARKDVAAVVADRRAEDPRVAER